jgi:phosphatidylserine decarboxylase
LRDFIYGSQEKADAFNSAVTSARALENGSLVEMNAEKIHDVNDYIRFVDEVLRWAPKVSSKGDELLQKILIFYWIFEQPTVRILQTSIQPKSAGTQLTWLSSWLVRFAREQGHYMDTHDSAKGVKSFYENHLYNKEAALWEKIPDGGWKSFNHFFARNWADIRVARPIDGINDDSIIVHAADSMFDGSWNINNGIVNIKSINSKGIDWPVNKLLQYAGDDFKNGSLMHAFLSSHDYHRQHAPVSGTVIEVKSIQDQVYLQVTKKKDASGLAPDRGLARDPHDSLRRQGVQAQNGGDFYELDEQDEVGYQWCQTRGLIIIKTKERGKVAVLPIGKAQVSSVIFTVNKGDEVGSDVVLVFEERVKYRENL